MVSLINPRIPKPPKQFSIVNLLSAIIVFLILTAVILFLLIALFSANTPHTTYPTALPAPVSEYSQPYPTPQDANPPEGDIDHIPDKGELSEQIYNWAQTDANYYYDKHPDLPAFSYKTARQMALKWGSTSHNLSGTRLNEYADDLINALITIRLIRIELDKQLNSSQL